MQVVRPTVHTRQFCRQIRPPEVWGTRNAVDVPSRSCRNIPAIMFVEWKWTKNKIIIILPSSRGCFLIQRWFDTLVWCSVWNRRWERPGCDRYPFLGFPCAWTVFLLDARNFHASADNHGNAKNTHPPCTPSTSPNHNRRQWFVR